MRSAFYRAMWLNTNSDIVEYLKQTEYIPAHSRRLLVRLVGVSDGPLSISFSDPIMQLPLPGFKAAIKDRIDEDYPGHGHVYYEIYQI